MRQSKKAIRKRIEKAAEKGYRHLRDGDYDAALAVASRLRRARYTAAFEIGAIAHAAKGDLAAAIDLLEEGVGLAPTVWLNWQLLGNYRSDLKKFEAATVAYDAALRCPNVNASSVYLNLAILAERRGRLAEALDWAARVTDSELVVHAAPLRIRALSGLDKLRDAETVAVRSLARQQGGFEFGRIAAALGWARLQHRVERQRVRAFAVKSLAQARDSSDLLSLIREIDGRHSRAAKYWRLLIEVKFAKPDPKLKGPIGFVATYDVVAGNRAEALRFIKSVENVPRRASVSISEAEVLESRPHDPKGVYRLTDRCFFAADE